MLIIYISPKHLLGTLSNCVCSAAVSQMTACKNTTSTSNQVQNSLLVNLAMQTATPHTTMMK